MQTGPSMASARDGSGAEGARASPTRRPTRRPLRGVNLLAELEALVAIGGGRFDLGVHHVVNIYRDAPLAKLSGSPLPNPFAQRRDRRHWVAHVEDEDAYVLARVDEGPSRALTAVLAVAWPRLSSHYRERALARVMDLDDGMSRAWRQAGGAPYWRPPIPTTLQTHLVVDAADSSFTGVRR